MSDKDLAIKNSRTGHLIRGLQNAGFAFPIWILFFHDHLGISIGLAIALGVSRWVVSAICELPTGSWADRFGRVIMLKVGFLGSALMILPFFFTTNIYLLFGAQIVNGFFSAMTSGVLNPLVKNSYMKASWSEKSYKKYLSTNNVVLYISRLLAGVFGALLYTKHPFGPYFLDFIATALAFVATFGLTEVWVKRSTATSNYLQISEALSYVWKHTYLRYFFFIVITYTFVSESMWTALQPIFEYRGIDPKYFGLLFGLVALLSALGSYLYRKIPESVDEILVRKYMVVAVVLGAIVMQINTLAAVILFVVIIGLSFGFSTVNSNLAIQKHVEPNHQSTVLSFYSLLGTMFYSITSLLVGLWADLYGVRVLLVILLIQTFVGLLTVLILSKFAFKKTKLV